jgi:hypothetical protein
VPGRVLCVAEQWASAAYLTALARHWQATPPAFDWRLAASAPLLGTIGDEVELAARVVTIEPHDRLDIHGWRPTVLLASAGGVPREFAFVAAARRAGIAALQFVDTWYNYHRRFVHEGGLMLPDRIFVIDDKAVEEARAEGIPEPIVTTVGHPVWETVERLPPTKSRNVVFVDAPVMRDYGRRLGYTEDDSWRMLCAAKQERPDLFGQVRFAPHPDHARPDLPSDVEVVRYHGDLLRTVGTIVGMFSAPLVDAYLAGRRSISLQPSASDIDMCPLTRHGRLVRRRTADELVAALDEAPADPSELRSALAGSARRVTAAIEAVAA